MTKMELRLADLMERLGEIVEKHIEDRSRDLRWLLEDWAEMVRVRNGCGRYGHP